MQFKPIYLRHQQVATLEHIRMLRMSEIPIGSAISVPLPTKRWGPPSYAFFASPTLSSATTITQSAPDRWWVINAHGGNLLIYAHWDIQPYAQAGDWDDVIIPLATIEKDTQAEQQIMELFEVLTPAFFADEHGDSTSRLALLTGLSHIFPPALLMQYQMLAPDFFAWLAE